MSDLKRFIKEHHVTQNELLIQDDPGMMQFTANEFASDPIEGDMLVTMLQESDEMEDLCKAVAKGDQVNADLFTQQLQLLNDTNMKEAIQRLYSEGF